LGFQILIEKKYGVTQDEDSLRKQAFMKVLQESASGNKSVYHVPKNNVAKIEEK